jgi:conserved oligomeric Golgi complex subunit 6
MRRKVVLQDFIEALTQGENALSARAIDIQAHDPLRYLGDILAWTHQAVAGEKEILNLIFGVAANSRQSQLEPGSERWLEDGTILSALEDLIERDLEGTVRPIRVLLRVKFVLICSHESSILSPLRKIRRLYFD